MTALYAALIAFLTYASVYAYRKPFTVATFGGASFWGLPYQTLLIISQVIGYMFSKFYGIRFIAELKRLGRWKTSAALIGMAWLSLLLFAITPAPWGMIWFFANGFVLGFMWGIIFSYVEGRRATDFIGSAMAISFIFAGGFTRSVAQWLMDRWSVREQWMPFATGLIFALPLAIFIYLMEKLPPPDEDDIRERTVRVPMGREQRKEFLRVFGFAIVIIAVTYSFLTVMRDIRDNYMANMWTELGYANNYGVFTKTETKTSVILLAIMSLLVLISNNIRAFRLIHLVIISGFLLAGISSWLFINQKIEGALWMQLVGTGLYMAYIPFNAIFFERMIASFGIAGNVGFLIYIADAYGYLGSVVIMLGKSFLQVNLNWSSFYSEATVIFAMIGCVGTVLSLLYFNRKYRSQKQKQ